MVRLSFGALSLWGLLWLLAGCRTNLGPWQDLPPPAAILTTAEPVWQQLAARRRSLHNLKGLAQVHLSIPMHSVSIEETVVVLQGLTAMRLEGIGPFGQPLFLLIADEQRFALYYPQEARLISGTASAQNLARLLGVELAPMVLHRVLTGDVPLTSLPVTGTFAYLPNHNLYIWEGQEPEPLQDYRVWFEPYQLQPVRFEVVQPSGEVALRVQYEDWQPLGEVTLPYRIIIVQPLAQRRLVWQYSEVEPNTGVSPALFRMRVPAGIQRVEIE
ncbi:hypothetical protein NKDENANG_03108 [Candidatus Entotheonellaceae bacterium PAL068K]